MDAPDSGQERSTFQIQALIAALIATLLAALNFTSSPVPDSSRPSGQAERQALDNLELRMWEDPLADWLARTPQAPYPPRCQSTDQAFSHETGKHLRLFVLANSGSSAEDSERRIRTRAAVLAAVHRWDYDPIDSEHLSGPCSINDDFGAMIERFRLATTPDQREWQRSRQGLPKIYESRAEKLSVYWLDDRKLRIAVTDQQSAVLYSELISAIGKQARPDTSEPPASTQSSPQRKAPSLVLLGPIDQDVTERIEEGLKLSQPCENASCRPLALSLRHFRSQASTQPKPNRSVQDRHLFEVGTTEAAQAETLIEELERRALNLTRPRGEPGRAGGQRTLDANRYVCMFKDHVALVSEWDTHHARQFRRAFANALKLRDTQIHAELRNVDAPNLHGFSYTRGLDGKGARISSAVSTESSGPVEGRRDSSFERSEQQSQRDYVRRLVDRIGERDRELKNQCRSASIGIHAIGILGSDFHDKKMLLQAFRARFPQAVFFTTRLDARMVDYQNSSLMRNLLVVSRFDLELAPAVQRFIIPFRDSEQTSLFLASSIALLGHDAPGDVIAGWLDRWNRLAPRLNEIGLQHIHSLTPFPGGEHCSLLDQAEAPENLLDCQDIHPPRQHLSRASLQLMTLSLSLAALLCYLLCAIVWAPVCRIRFFYLLGGFAALILPPDLCYLILHGATEAWSEEPFAWADGISVWPSLWLRWAALVLSLGLLARSWATTQLTLQEIPTAFGLYPMPDTKLGLFGEARRALHSALTRARQACHPGREAFIQPKARHAWRHFRHNVSPAQMFALGTLWALVVLSLLLLINLNSPHLPPVRGQFARVLFYAISGLGTFLFLLLVFFALSFAIRIRELSITLCTHYSAWPNRAFATALIELRRQQLDDSVISGACREMNSFPSVVALIGSEDRPPAGRGLTEKLERAFGQDRQANEKLRAHKRLDRLFDHFIDMLMLEDLSRRHEWLQFYPGIVLSLIITSRWSHFDAWPNDPLSFALIGLFGFAALLSVWLIQDAAKQARNSTLNNLAGIAASLKPEERDTIRLFRHIQTQVEQARTGIFRPIRWSMVRALLLPLASAAGLRGAEALFSVLQ